MSVDRLRVEFTAQGCQLPEDERARVQDWLRDLSMAAADFAEAALEANVVFHPRTQSYSVKFKLRLPGRTLFTGEDDPYLDSALGRCFDKMRRKVEAYRDSPDRGAMEAAERRAALDNNVVVPEDPDAGPLAEAASAGDYRRFRTDLAGYEDWLRLRVGRLVQADEQAQARLGRDLLLGDVIEEVYLNAFEAFTKRRTDQRLGAWLESLIEPSIRALIQNPDEEREAASLARTMRDAKLT